MLKNVRNYNINSSFAFLVSHIKTYLIKQLLSALLQTKKQNYCQTKQLKTSNVARKEVKRNNMFQELLIRHVSKLLPHSESFPQKAADHESVTCFSYISKL